MENKNELILDIVEDLLENHYDSQEYIKCLLIEALSIRTIEELKEINAQRIKDKYYGLKLIEL